MRLFVLRHGQAEPYDIDDFHRVLTPAGCDEISTVVRNNIHDLSSVVDIWASPYVRTQQTCQIAAKLLSIDTINICEFLVPDANPIALIDLLYKSQSDVILLVSHQPLVSRLINLLRDSDDLDLQMNTGSLASIEFDVVAIGLGLLNWVKSHH